METILSAISNVGYPIVSCIIMVWLMNRQQERHSKDIETMTEALDNNTKAITKLAVKMGVDVNE